MCGICGVIAPNPLRAGESVARMNRRQAHRGPDDEGAQSFTLPGGWSLVLGQRRLAILDLSASGSQPMHNPQTGNWIVFNGEIYNYPELRHQLQSEGDGFDSTSDTEVVLKACDRWGLRALDRLYGMFAFAHYDARRQLLMLARDPLGIKPLYYAWSPGGEFVFASEVRAIAASGLVPAELDRAALASALAYGAVQQPLTVLRSVAALPAGQWLTIDLAGPVPRIIARGYHYSIPEAGSWKGVRADAVDELRERLDGVVESHLLSDVPVGLFLSAGVDSAAIASVCRRLGRTPEAFTVTLDGFSDLNEQPLAAELAGRCGLKHHSVHIPGSCVPDWFRQFVGAMDQPTVDGFNTFLISEAIRAQGFKVVLSGLGGDELFGGYDHMRQVPRLWRINRALRWTPGFSRRALVRRIGRHMSPCHREKLHDLLLRPMDLHDVALGRHRLFSDAALERMGFPARSLAELDGQWLPTGGDVRRGVAERDPLASVGVLEARYYMGNTLLRDSDVFGMAHGIEIRVPWLDRRIIDLVLSFPGALRQPRAGINKPLLVEAADVPDSVARRRKTGFGLPLAHWLGHDLGDFVAPALDKLVSDGILAAEGVNAVRQDFEHSPALAEGARLWMLVVLGRWWLSFQQWCAA